MLGVVTEVSLDLALLAIGFLLLMHSLNLRLRRPNIAEQTRYLRLANRLLRCHHPRSGAYALASELASNCRDLIEHHGSYSLAAYCWRGWYRRCRSLERRGGQLYDAYVLAAGHPASVLRGYEDEED